MSRLGSGPRNLALTEAWSPRCTPGHAGSLVRVTESAGWSAPLSPTTHMECRSAFYLEDEEPNHDFAGIEL